MKQMPLVVNIRGNSGSGKTHLTREFMELCKAEPRKNGLGKVIGYAGKYKGKSVFFLGRYETACGGCDTIKTQVEVVQLVTNAVAMKFDLIWLEGLIMSTIYGTVGSYSEQFGDRWLFAYLDTPLSVCLKRVQSRRDAAGNTKPFNPSNTTNRYLTIIRNREIVQTNGRRSIVLPHQNALAPLLKIIKKEG